MGRGGDGKGALGGEGEEWKGEGKGKGKGREREGRGGGAFRQIKIYDYTPAALLTEVRLAAFLLMKNAIEVPRHRYTDTLSANDLSESKQPYKQYIMTQNYKRHKFTVMCCHY